LETSFVICLELKIMFISPLCQHFGPKCICDKLCKIASLSKTKWAFH
jgi:hypothetical protein